MEYLFQLFQIEQVYLWGKMPQLPYEPYHPRPFPDWRYRYYWGLGILVNARLLQTGNYRASLSCQEPQVRRPPIVPRRGGRSAVASGIIGLSDSAWRCLRHCGDFHYPPHPGLGVDGRRLMGRENGNHETRS